MSILSHDDTMTRHPCIVATTLI